MALKVFNTLGREKQEFLPQSAGTVKMYVCGPTVYDFCHLGHAKAYVSFDVIRRYLEFKGFAVDYAQNFTDVDDKIIARSQRDGIGLEELTKKFAKAYLEDMGLLNVKPATRYVKVTEHMEDIIRLVQALIEKGFGYEVEGNVYFSVEKFPNYGRLSCLDAEKTKEAVRIEQDSRKRGQLDFALWKAAKPGEPAWQSPWGKGRPGWHIECSAMSLKYLGPTLDIHGGGMDLIFPHHENEIAQSEGATGKPFVNYWLHNGFVTVNKEKMSKSLGNFFTVRDILKKYAAETVRFFLVSTHYRNPVDFDDGQLEAAKNSLTRLTNSLDAAELAKKDGQADDRELDKLKTSFVEAMDDDFNTAAAIAVLFELAGVLNRRVAEGRGVAAAKELLLELGGVLGLFAKRAEQGFVENGPEPAETEEKLLASLPGSLVEVIRLRQGLQKRKKWTEADAIRNRLKACGYIIEDAANGTHWKRI